MLERIGVIRWALQYLPLGKKLKWRVLKEAAGVYILGQQLFDRAPQLRVMVAHPVEEGTSLVRFKRQCSLEQLFHEIRLSRHNTQSPKAIASKELFAGEGSGGILVRKLPIIPER